MGVMIVCVDQDPVLPPKLRDACDGEYRLEVIVEVDGQLTAVGVLDETRPHWPTAKKVLAMRVPQADFANKLAFAPRRPRRPDDPPPLE
jgi:hypothetical protein